MSGPESYGWVCPKCGRVLAPWMSECPCFMEKAQVTCQETGTYPGNLFNDLANRQPSVGDYTYFDKTTAGGPVAPIDISCSNDNSNK